MFFGYWTAPSSRQPPSPHVHAIASQRAPFIVVCVVLLSFRHHFRWVFHQTQRAHFVIFSFSSYNFLFFFDLKRERARRMCHHLLFLHKNPPKRINIKRHSLEIKFSARGYRHFVQIEPHSRFDWLACLCSGYSHAGPRGPTAWRGEPARSRPHQGDQELNALRLPHLIVILIG